MSVNFNGINIGLRALQTQKKSLDITGHNIANANNEAYSRQRAVHSATTPYPVPGGNLPGGAGQVGTGVEISQIQRIRDDFIDNQVRLESQQSGKWNKLAEGLNRIELILNEPSDSGLAAALDDFWSSLQDLAVFPEDPAARSAVQQRGLALVNCFQSIHSQLTEYKRSLNNDVTSIADEINSYSTRIADLNRQIASIEATGNQANDLLDTRNHLFNELNEKAAVSGYTDQNNRLNISLGGVPLVSGIRTEELTISKGQLPDHLYEDTVIFATTGNQAQINSGELAGIIETRDQTIDTYRDFLDKIAYGMAEKFNEVHRTGYNTQGEIGVDFFTVGEQKNAAAQIELSAEIRESISNIAAGNFSDNPQSVRITALRDLTEAGYDFDPDLYEYEIRVSSDPGAADFIYNIQEITGGQVVNEMTATVNQGIGINTADFGFNGEFTFELQQTGEARIFLRGSPGSGANAVALADSLKDERVIEGEASVMKSYEALISTLGVVGQRSGQMVKNQEALLTQLTNQQQSYSGVSLDEEMANIIKYQQAYNAAAQLISTTNQLLDSLLAIMR